MTVIASSAAPNQAIAAGHRAPARSFPLRSSPILAQRTRALAPSEACHCQAPVGDALPHKTSQPVLVFAPSKLGFQSWPAPRPARVCSRWPFACVWLARSVLISGRSKPCPFSSRAAPTVARPPQASMVGLWGAGLASFGFHLQPRLYRPGDQISLGDAWQSFSMEASVCLPCDVSQKWFGLEPRQ
jgi:hypothetical protein